MTFQPDHKAAAIHRERAGRAYDEAEQFRKLGLRRAYEAARQAGRDEDRIAELLTGTRRAAV